MTDPMINRVLGQYQLVELAGRGGMASVYRAHQPSLDRFVAVKVLQHHGNAEYIARFKSEARSLALLQHPNILPVHDYGEQDDVLYLVLQYVPGGASLADREGGGAWPQAAVLEVGQRLLDGLAYAHSKGIVHRDIKPANILLPSPSWPMLADFGLSKLLSESGMNLTAPGTIMGTVNYMPPEQVTSQPIDARSDIYSAGVVFYELLTGKLPFEGNTPMEVLVKHAYAPPPPPRSFNPAIPEALEHVVLRALAKSPADRYQAAAAMAADLKRIAERPQPSVVAATSPTILLPAVAATGPLPAAPVSVPVPTPDLSPAQPSYKRRWALPLIAALLLALATGAAFAFWPRPAPLAALAPTAAPAPTAIAARPTAAPNSTPLPPTPLPAAATAPPTVAPALVAGGVGPSGEVRFHDADLWSDAATVTVRGLPGAPAGQVYAAWLSNASGSLFLGVLAPGADGALDASYVSPSHQNLLGVYDRVYISQVPEAAADSEVANVVLAGGLPPEPLMHLRHNLFSYQSTPSQIGYLTGLRREVAEVLVHAQRLAKSLDDSNLASAQSHAEHVVNVIEGQFGPHYGDLNGDGKVQNPGDGFGLLKNGAQEGYIEGVLHHVLVAAAAPDAPETLRRGADGVKLLGTAIEEHAAQIRDLALRIAAAKGPEAARADAQALLALAQQIDTGEGGIETIYTQVQNMAQVALAQPAPGVANDAPPPVRVAADPPPAIVIAMTDDAYSPLKETVAPGTTIVWKNAGTSAHTVTADDDSFDSKSIAPGESFSYTFTKVESFPYFCTIHGGAHGEGMAGAVEVQAPAQGDAQP